MLVGTANRENVEREAQGRLSLVSQSVDVRGRICADAISLSSPIVDQLGAGLTVGHTGRCQHFRVSRLVQRLRSFTTRRPHACPGTDMPSPLDFTAALDLSTYPMSRPLLPLVFSSAPSCFWMPWQTFSSDRMTDLAPTLQHDAATPFESYLRNMRTTIPISFSR